MNPLPLDVAPSPGVSPRASGSSGVSNVRAEREREREREKDKRDKKDKKDKYASHVHPHDRPGVPKPEPPPVPAWPPPLSPDVVDPDAEIDWERVERPPSPSQDPGLSYELERMKEESPHLRPHELFWKAVYPWLEGRGYRLRPRYAPGWKPSWKSAAADEKGQGKGKGKGKGKGGAGEGEDWLVSEVCVSFYMSSVRRLLSFRPFIVSFYLRSWSFLPHFVYVHHNLSQC
jgi:hypothetical protein